MIGAHAFAVLQVTVDLLLEYPELRDLAEAKGKRLTTGDTVVYDPAHPGAEHGWVIGDEDVDDWALQAGNGVQDVHVIVFDEFGDPEEELTEDTADRGPQGIWIGARPVGDRPLEGADDGFLFEYSARDGSQERAFAGWMPAGC